MSKASAETPSKAQKSCVGMLSTNRGDGGLATTGGVVRTNWVDGTLPGLSGALAMRAVSLRGLVWMAARLSGERGPVAKTGFGPSGAGGAGACGGALSPAGRIGFSVTEDGGRTGLDGGRKLVTGGFSPASKSGGRCGKSVRGVPFSEGRFGCRVGAGGKVARVVSFSGSFTAICVAKRARSVNHETRFTRANRSRGSREWSA